MKMSMIIICICILAAAWFAFYASENKKIAGSICSVLSAIIIGILVNYLSNPVEPPPNDTHPQPPQIEETNKTNVDNTEDVSKGTVPENIKEDTEIIKDKISLLKMDTFYSDGIGYSNDDIIDNEGTKYIGYAYMSSGNFSPDYDGVATYQNKNYERVTGRVITKHKFRNSENCGWIRIYGDDELLFDSELMHRGISPKDFDVNVSQYSEIKFEFKGGLLSTHETDIDYATAQCYLVNTYFYYKK